MGCSLHAAEFGRGAELGLDGTGREQRPATAARLRTHTAQLRSLEIAVAVPGGRGPKGP